MLLRVKRLAQSQQEDDDFQKQLSSILNRVDISKNRASVYEMIRNMEVPKVQEANGH
uniref:Cullin_Nedd8 domain-containing protein n=1 Tax=Ascaris lumbricoides TaxID=6252 RepID=A0A0M3I6V6_ASCLU